MGELQSSGTAGEGPRDIVLVIDDQADVRRVITEQLRRAGNRTLEAEDGTGAIHSFAEHSAEIVAATLDLDMPKTNGRETLAMLSEYAPNLPIVVITGKSVDELVGRTPGTRGVAYMAKPADNEAFIQVLKMLIAEMADDARK